MHNNYFICRSMIFNLFPTFFYLPPYPSSALNSNAKWFCKPNKPCELSRLKNALLKSLKHIWFIPLYSDIMYVFWNSREHCAKLCLDFLSLSFHVYFLFKNGILQNDFVCLVINQDARFIFDLLLLKLNCFFVFFTFEFYSVFLNYSQTCKEFLKKKLVVFYAHK